MYDVIITSSFGALSKEVKIANNNNNNINSSNNKSKGNVVRHASAINGNATDTGTKNDMTNNNNNNNSNNNTQQDDAITKLESDCNDDTKFIPSVAKQVKKQHKQQQKQQQQHQQQQESCNVSSCITATGNTMTSNNSIVNNEIQCVDVQYVVTITTGNDPEEEEDDEVVASRSEYYEDERKISIQNTNTESFLYPFNILYGTKSNAKLDPLLEEEKQHLHAYYSLRQSEIETMIQLYDTIEKNALTVVLTNSKSNTSMMDNNNNTLMPKHQQQQQQQQQQQYQLQTMKRKNQSQILLLSGPSGTGKSTLVSFLHKYHKLKEQQQQQHQRNDNVCTSSTATTTTNSSRTWWNYTFNGYFDQIQRPDQPYIPYIRSITIFLQSLDDRDRSIIAQNIYTTITNEDDIQLLKETIPEIAQLFTIDNNNHTSNSSTTGSTADTEKKHPNNNHNIINVDIESVSYMNLIHNFKRLFPLILQCLFPESPILYRTKSNEKTSRNVENDKEEVEIQQQSSTLSFQRKNSSLVLFHFQDIHWANEMDMDLLLHLTIDVSCPTILFVVTSTVGCDNASTTESLIPVIRRHNLAFDTVTKRITSIHLHRFNEQQVSSKLLSEQQDKIPLVYKSIILDNSAGNPYLLMLYLKQILDSTTSVVPLDNVTSYAKCINNIIASKLKEVPIETEQIMLLVSCLGKRIDNTIVQYFSSTFEQSFREAKDIGLLLYDEYTVSWCFVHDKVQEMIYESMSIEDRVAFHYNIGRTLWKKLDMTDLIRNIFIVVDQLLIGRECIMGGYDEQIGIAKLCLSAGQRAFQVSAFQTARSYFLSGISLLDSRRCWMNTNTRDIAIQLHSGAAECCFCCGYLQEVFYHKTLIITNVHNYDETIRVRMIAMNALGGTGHLVGAVKDSMDILRYLKETFPKRPGIFALHKAMTGLKRLIRTKLSNDITKLLDLPVMHDQRKVQAMQVYNVGILYAMVAYKELGFLFVIRIIVLTIQYGISELSCLGLASYANWRCNLGHTDEGHRIGNVSRILFERFHNRYFLPRFYVVYYSFVHPRTNPINECVQQLFYAQQVGLQTGDNECAMFTGFVAYSLGFDSMHLDEINEGFQSLSERMQILNQTTTLQIIKPIWQATQNLIGLANNDPAILSGRILEENELDTFLRVNPSFNRFSHYPQALVLYLFGNHQSALVILSRFRRSRSALDFNPSIDAMSLMLEGLCRISMKCTLRTVHYLSIKLRRLASNEPKRNLAKYVLLQAEIASYYGARTRSRRRRSTILTKYFTAVSVAKESNSLLLYGLANELTARYMLSPRCRSGSVLTAEQYIRQAIIAYNEWGAYAKAQHLQNEMPEYICNHIYE